MHRNLPNPQGHNFDPSNDPDLSMPQLSQSGLTPALPALRRALSLETILETSDLLDSQKFETAHYFGSDCTLEVEDDPDLALQSDALYYEIFRGSLRDAIEQNSHIINRPGTDRAEPLVVLLRDAFEHWVERPTFVIEYCRQILEAFSSTSALIREQISDVAERAFFEAGELQDPANIVQLVPYCERGFFIRNDVCSVLHSVATAQLSSGEELTSLVRMLEHPAFVWFKKQFALDSDFKEHYKSELIRNLGLLTHDGICNRPEQIGYFAELFGLDRFMESEQFLDELGSAIGLKLEYGRFADLDRWIALLPREEHNPEEFTKGAQALLRQLRGPAEDAVLSAASAGRVELFKAADLVIDLCCDPQFRSDSRLREAVIDGTLEILDRRNGVIDADLPATLLNPKMRSVVFQNAEIAAAVRSQLMRMVHQNNRHIRECLHRFNRNPVLLSREEESAVYSQLKSISRAHNGLNSVAKAFGMSDLLSKSEPITPLRTRLLALGYSDPFAPIDHNQRKPVSRLAWNQYFKLAQLLLSGNETTEASQMAVQLRHLLTRVPLDNLDFMRKLSAVERIHASIKPEGSDKAEHFERILAYRLGLGILDPLVLESAIDVATVREYCGDVLKAQPFKNLARALMRGMELFRLPRSSPSALSTASFNIRVALSECAKFLKVESEELDKSTALCGM
ncbi:MAG: hypothetical protein J5J00_13730 [Deltaproteobacteria bacterium]|nr:hypothetical protein [Deltaproteobacteria bacterium]